MTDADLAKLERLCEAALPLGCEARELVETNGQATDENWRFYYRHAAAVAAEYLRRIKAANGNEPPSHGQDASQGSPASDRGPAVGPERPAERAASPQVAAPPASSSSG